MKRKPKRGKVICRQAGRTLYFAQSDLSHFFPKVNYYAVFERLYRRITKQSDEPRLTPNTNERD